MVVRAAVFDFDGVLVDSMSLHARAYQDSLAPLGVPVRVEHVYELEGGRSESLIARFLQDAGKSADPALVSRLSQEKQVVYTRLGPPKLFEGADQMVRSVRERAERMGLVTGTRRENLQRFIPGLLPLFDTVLAQDAYTHDKPDPEPYVKTARALDIPPEECVAVENAPFGVRSARSAGYGQVVAITTTVSRQRLLESGAHVVVSRHSEAAREVLHALGR